MECISNKSNYLPFLFSLLRKTSTRINLHLNANENEKEEDTMRMRVREREVLRTKANKFAHSFLQHEEKHFSM